MSFLNGGHRGHIYIYGYANCYHEKRKCMCADVYIYSHHFQFIIKENIFKQIQIH